MSRSTRSSAYRDRGGSSSDSIDFSHNKQLSLPGDRSDDKVWSSFFYECTYLSSREYSLTVAFGENPDEAVTSAYRMTRKLMTPREAKEFQEWENGRRLPRADWKRLRTSVNSTTSKQRERWEDFAMALARLYNDDNIDLDNAKAWVEKHEDKMTLLVAAKKVEITRRDIARAKRHSSSSAIRLVREAIACRKLLSEIGIFRGELGRNTKELNVKSSKRENEVLRDISRLDRKGPSTEAFRLRGKLFDKLEKVRYDRVQNGIRHSQLMAESKCAEEAVRSRLNDVNVLLSERRRR